MVNKTFKKWTKINHAGTVTENGVDALIGGAIDTLGDIKNSVFFYFRAIGNGGAHVVSLQESDDNANWTNVIGDETLRQDVLTRPTANYIAHLGYIGNKRYLRGVVTPASGNNSNITVDFINFTGPEYSQDSN